MQLKNPPSPTTTTDETNSDVARVSTLNAGNDIKLLAGGDVTLEGTQVDAGADIGISAENINILSATDTVNSNNQTSYQQTGLNLSASMSNVSITAGLSKNDSETDNTNTTAIGSNLNAGGNLNLNATNDLNIEGSDVSADNDISLVAGNDINITAAENTYNTATEDSNLSVGGGLNFGSEGVGFTANLAMGEGELDRQGNTFTNSHITAGNNLTVVSGNDTNIIGGNLSGSDVNMDIGGDLTVASVQGEGQVEGSRWDVSVSATFGAGASVNGSVGAGETSGSSAWVDEQTSITGSNSVTIRTEGHTQIDGAVIANVDSEGNDQGNLIIDTGSLGYTDIEDHDKEDSFYLNVGFGTGDNSSTNQQESGNSWSVEGNSYNKDREQINRATIGEGTITVRDNPDQDLSDLNRDVDIAQEITKDEESSTELYASSTAVDSLGNLATDPGAQLDQWGNNIANVVDPDAWKQVGENATDAIEDTLNAVNQINDKQNLDAGDFLKTLDNTHKITQLKNDLTRTPEGQELLARLASDDPDVQLAAEKELGNMAQEKFGIDPTEISFYDASQTESESLQDGLITDVKGGVVNEEGHINHGEIFVDVTSAENAKELTETLGHEVYETVTIQTGGEQNAAQEDMADVVGSQLANRIDDAMDGGLANVSTDGYTNTQTVQTGTQRSNGVGNANVEYSAACMHANLCSARDFIEHMGLELATSDDPKRRAMGEEQLALVSEIDKLNTEDKAAFLKKVKEKGLVEAIKSGLQDTVAGAKALYDNPELLNDVVDNYVDDLTGVNGPARQIVASDNLASDLLVTALTLPVGGGAIKAADKVTDVVSDVNKPDYPTIETPYGPAHQSTSPEALAVRDAVENGADLNRGGSLGQSHAGEGQFWSTDDPLSPGYAERNGIPAENYPPDFVCSGQLCDGAPFITREAPGVGANGGGAIEVVTEAGGVKLDNFHMPDKSGNGTPTGNDSTNPSNSGNAKAETNSSARVKAESTQARVSQGEINVRGDISQGGFASGISADEVKQLNQNLGNTAGAYRDVSVALDNASRYDGFYDKSASLIRDIAGGHLFKDGNKRTAQALVEELAKRNNVATMPNPTQLRVIIKRASDSSRKDHLKSVEDIAKALRGF